jgi:hypothetical protein
MRKVLLLVDCICFLGVGLVEGIVGQKTNRARGAIFPSIILLIVCCITSINGQTITSSGGGTGAWNDPASWNGGVPTSANSTSVTISSGHTITVTDVRSIDQLTVDGTLVINSGQTLTIDDGTGADITISASGTVTNNGTFTLFVDPPPPPIFNATCLVSGLLQNSGTITNAATTRLFFLSGGTYEHKYTTTNGAIPLATWNSTSTCLISSYTSNSSAPTNLGQSFGNFTWNTPGQSAFIDLNGALTTVTGNLTIRNVPNSYLNLTSNTNVALTVGGDLEISNSFFGFNASATAATVHVVGNTLFSNNGDLTMTFDGNLVLDLDKNVDIQGGSLNLTYGGTGSITMTVAGNFSIASSPSITNGGSGTYALTFDGAAPQNYTASQDWPDFNYRIETGSVVNVGSSSFFSGSGKFTLAAGATLGVGSSAGLATGTTSGNVRVSGTRTYTATGNIVYNAAIAQNLGNEWGAGGALNAVAVNLEINNSSASGVTNNIIGSTSVVGVLTLTAGSLNIGNSNTFQIQGVFNGNGGTIGGDPTSSLTFSGSGSINGNLAFKAGGENLNNFTISRNGQTINLSTNLTIATTGTLLFSGSTNLQMNGITLDVEGNINQPSTGGLTRTSGLTNIVIGGSGALTELPFTLSPTWNNITFSRNSGTYDWGSAATVAGTLALNAGTFNHSSGLTMAGGSTFSRSAGTTYTGNAPNAGGAYDVSYVGNVTTGLELPTNTTDLRNLTVGGNVTLANSITVNGTLAINSGTLAATNHDVTIAGATFVVNGGSFSINAANLVTFSFAGTTSLSGSTINGTQFGNLTINSGTTVSAPNANLNVSGTWDNNGTFIANSGKITFTGASQGINPNGQAFNDVEFAGTGTKTLAGALDANGTLTITSTLNVGGNNPINVGGSWNNNGTFVAGGGTVTFDGTAQIIAANGQAFFNLTIAGSGTKVLSQAVVIGGALTINSGTTLDVGPGNNPITLTGNWVNNGSFTKRSGTITFNGTTILSGSTAPDLNNVTITGALTAYSGTTGVSGNWLQSSGTFTHNGGTLDFNGNAQSITPAGQTFNNVTISGTNTKTLAGTTVIAGTLTLSGGTLDTNAQNVSIAGNFVSNSPSVLTASTITFNGTTALSGSTAPTFGAITIATSSSLTPSASFNINGNLVNNGTLNASAGTVTFGGTTTISGSTTTNSFNNVTVTGVVNASSGIFNVGGNWSNSNTFNPGTGTVGFTGNTSFTGTASFNHVIISGTVNAPSTFNVAGNLTNNGTFNRGTGTVVFNGTAGQSISGSATTDFNNISVTNTAAPVVVSTSQNLRGVLTLATNTTFDADGAGAAVFTLVSTADSPTVDAAIATLPSGASVTGNVTVQRFMSLEGGSGGNTRIYRYISSPVANASVSDIQNEIQVTGTFAGASSCSGCGTAQSMFLYDETVTTDINASGTADLNDGYTNFPVAANTETFAPGRGYTIFVRGNLLSGSAMWDLRGPVNSGNLSLPVSFTSANGVSNDGWNLVGNPYPSTIDWLAGGWTKTNVNDAFYMLDNGLGTPAYATFIGGVGTNGATRYIPIGQAFFVKSDGGSPALSLTEAVKVAGQQTTFFKTTTPVDYIRVALHQGTKRDETIIRFTKNATAAFDPQWDARKLANPGTMFSFSSIGADNGKYAVNALKEVNKRSEIKLNISAAAAGNYSLDFSEMESFSDTGLKIYLLDSLTGATTDVRLNPSYPFQLTSATSVTGSTRFSIVFEEAIVTEVEKTLEQHISVYPNPTTGIVNVAVKSDNEVRGRIVSLTGLPVAEKALEGSSVKKGSFDITEQADGMYILIIQDGTNSYQTRIIKKR